jgi:hypothetical protein
LEEVVAPADRVLVPEEELAGIISPGWTGHLEHGDGPLGHLSQDPGQHSGGDGTAGCACPPEPTLAVPGPAVPRLRIPGLGPIPGGEEPHPGVDSGLGDPSPAPALEEPSQDLPEPLPGEGSGILAGNARCELPEEALSGGEARPLQCRGGEVPAGLILCLPENAGQIVQGEIGEGGWLRRVGIDH